MRRRLVLFALLASPVFCPLPCRSQARPPGTGSAVRTFSLRGSVRNSDDGRPFEMVKVDLKRVTGEVVGTTFTRSNGEFEFPGLPNGLYLIVLEEKGFQSVRPEQITALVRNSGALDRARRLAVDYALRAKACLNGGGHSDFGRALLTVPDFILERES